MSISHHHNPLRQLLQPIPQGKKKSQAVSEAQSHKIMRGGFSPGVICAKGEELEPGWEQQQREPHVSAAGCGTGVCRAAPGTVATRLKMGLWDPGQKS